MTRRILSLAIAVLALVLPARILADEPAKPLLPAHATWSMHYDSKLDGEVTGKRSDDVMWDLTVRNDRITGKLTGLKPGDPKGHHIAGEFVLGKPAILLLRQDGPNGLVCYYTGKLGGDGRFVGAWFDNRGSSGDFEMSEVKK